MGHRRGLPAGAGGPALVEEVKDPARRCYRPEAAPIIPFEFADAAFRYGHGQIRHRYRLQPGGDEYSVFPDLVGFAPVALEHCVDWRLLFGDAAQPAKRMDGRLAASLIGLPLAVTGAVDVDAYHLLAARDLQRGAAIGLPSGEAVAGAIGARPLTREEVAGALRLGGRDPGGSTCCARPTSTASASAWGRSAGAWWPRCCSAARCRPGVLPRAGLRLVADVPAAGERFAVLDLLVGVS